MMKTVWNVLLLYCIISSIINIVLLVLGIANPLIILIQSCINVAVMGIDLAYNNKR